MSIPALTQGSDALEWAQQNVPAFSDKDESPKSSKPMLDGLLVTEALDTPSELTRRP